MKSLYASATGWVEAFDVMAWAGGPQAALGFYCWTLERPKSHSWASRPPQPAENLTQRRSHPRNYSTSQRLATAPAVAQRWCVCMCVFLGRGLVPHHSAPSLGLQPVSTYSKGRKWEYIIIAALHFHCLSLWSTCLVHGLGSCHSNCSSFFVERIQANRSLSSQVLKAGRSKSKKRRMQGTFFASLKSKARLSVEKKKHTNVVVFSSFFFYHGIALCHCSCVSHLRNAACGLYLGSIQ